ncbi:MAG: hypothetical protein K0Q72_1235 [Armatimonadetes bacterium]|nr:hypothetical protein [Armatimonadota bacterium]
MTNTSSGLSPAPSDPVPPAAAPPAADLFELPVEAPAAAGDTPDEEPELLRKSWREELQEIDWGVVRTLIGQEALITIRSRAWTRLIAWFASGTILAALLPLFYRSAPGHWVTPPNRVWLVIWTGGTALALLAAVSGWTRRRISRELRAGSLDEILLTGSGPADILLGKVLATAGLALLLVIVAFPSALIAGAVGGQSLPAMLRLSLTLGFCAYLGLCVGMEYSFRSPGSRSSFSKLWTCFYVVLFLGNIARIVNWSFLAAPRRWIIAYNPVSTLFAATGSHSERWPIGITAFGVLLVVLTLVSFRLLRREWAQAAERAGEGSWLDRVFRPKVNRETLAMNRGEKFHGGALALEYRGNPIEVFERRFGHRLRVERWAWVVLSLLAGILMVFPTASFSRLVFAAALWGACLLAAHNGCAPFARERESGRWEELCLLPLSDREIAGGKLLVGGKSWLYAVVIAAVALVPGSFWRVQPEPQWVLWSLVTLLVLPPSMGLLGALLGLLTHSAEEAHWRVSLLSTAVPALLLAGSLAGFQLQGAAAICPLFGAVESSPLGVLNPYAWAGTLLYAVCGLAAGWLVTHHLRWFALHGPYAS